MQRDVNKSPNGKNLLKPIIIYGLIILVLGCAQCAFFPLLDFCPKTPDLILGMLLAITLLKDEKSAAVCAIVAGFFLDAVGSSMLSLSPLIYFLFVALIAPLAKKVLKSFASYMLLLIPTLLYRAAASYICACIAYRSVCGVWIIEEILIPEAIVTAVLCLPIYFIVKLCTHTLDTHSRFTF